MDDLVGAARGPEAFELVLDVLVGHGHHRFFQRDVLDFGEIKLRPNLHLTGERQRPVIRKLDLLHGGLHVCEFFALFALVVLALDPDQRVADDLQVGLVHGGHVARAEHLLDERGVDVPAKPLFQKPPRGPSLSEAGHDGLVAHLTVLLVKLLADRVARNGDGQLLAEPAEVLDLDVHDLLQFFLEALFLLLGLLILFFDVV